jgi:hypothetical protein
MRTEHPETVHRGQEIGFWQVVGSALATLARRTGCSASECPLPEVRAAARDVSRPRPNEPARRIPA